MKVLILDVYRNGIYFRKSYLNIQKIFVRLDVTSKVYKTAL